MGVFGWGVRWLFVHEAAPHPKTLEQGVESNNYKSTEWDMELHGGGCKAEDYGGDEDSNATGSEVIGIAGGPIGPAGRRPCAGM